MSQVIAINLTHFFVLNNIVSLKNAYFSLIVSNQIYLYSKK